MKRILGVILAVAMLFAMIPAVAAADTQTEGGSAEPVSVTYKFHNGGRSDAVGQSWIEKFTWTKASSFNDVTDFAIVRNSFFMSFPTTSENPNDQWAYAGSGLQQAMTYAAPTAGGSSVISMGAYFGTNTAGEDGWVAFKIKLPKTATYEISEITSHVYANGAGVNVYVVPATDELNAAVATAANSATNFHVGPEGTGNYVGKNIVFRDGFTPFSSFGITEDSLAGSYSSYGGDKTVLTRPVTNVKALALEADKEYYLFLNNTNVKCITIASITFTEAEKEDDEEEIPVARNQEYVFASRMTAGSGYVTTSYDEFSEIDENAGTDDWAITAYGAHSGGSPAYTQLGTNEVKFYADKSHYGTDNDISNKAVVALDVEAEGLYDISVTTAAVDSGTEADIYILSEKELTETYASHLKDGKVTTALFRELPIQGRVSSVGVSGEIVNNLGAKKLSGGTNYMIFHITDDNVKTLKIANNRQCINLKKINLNLTDSIAEEESATAITGKVSFASGADITLNGEAYSANTVASIDAGSTVTVKADKSIGNFAGWVRGRIDSGVYVSTEAEYTFDIMSNTYLTPVYSKEPSADGQKVEFWNANGSYIGSSDVADGSAIAPEATLAGHTFEKWLVSANKELTLINGAVDVSGIGGAIIRTVASFVTRESVGANAAENASYLEKNNYFTSIRNDENYTTTEKTAAEAQTTNLSLDRVLVNGVAQTKNFGDKVVCTDTNGTVTAWLRDGKIVSYNPTYTHYIWDGANIYSTYVKNIEKKPLVVIEDTSIDGAYMIEYDKGNADAVVEAGILFGSTKGIIINSTDGSKAATQKGEAHGQFCASPNGDESYARGYLIYKVGTKLYVVYTDAVAINR